MLAAFNRVTALPLPFKADEKLLASMSCVCIVSTALYRQAYKLRPSAVVSELVADQVQVACVELHGKRIVGAGGEQHPSVQEPWQAQSRVCTARN